MSRAEPCPFCGHDTPSLVRCAPPGRLYVMCPECEAEAPTVAAWNRRQASRQQPEPVAWIPVEERLPEPDVDVLGAGQGWGAPFVMACRYDAERREWWASGNHWTDAHGSPEYPTHWMHFPEPPRALLADSEPNNQKESAQERPTDGDHKL
jgi:hypothetical protein